MQLWNIPELRESFTSRSAEVTIWGEKGNHVYEPAGGLTRVVIVVKYLEICDLMAGKTSV